MAKLAPSDLAQVLSKLPRQSSENVIVGFDKSDDAGVFRLTDGPVVCAARVNLCPGTEFAGMWGGSTHPQWRRRGLFRALLSTRAQWAMDRGYRLAFAELAGGEKVAVAGHDRPALPTAAHDAKHRTCVRRLLGSDLPILAS